jgi:hypothetical protein
MMGAGVAELQCNRLAAGLGQEYGDQGRVNLFSVGNNQVQELLLSSWFPSTSVIAPKGQDIIAQGIALGR